MTNQSENNQTPEGRDLISGEEADSLIVPLSMDESSAIMEMVNLHRLESVFSENKESPEKSELQNSIESLFGEMIEGLNEGE